MALRLRKKKLSLKPTPKKVKKESGLQKFQAGGFAPSFRGTGPNLNVIRQTATSPFQNVGAPARQTQDLTGPVRNYLSSITAKQRNRELSRRNALLQAQFMRDREVQDRTFLQNRLTELNNAFSAAEDDLTKLDYNDGRQRAKGEQLRKSIAEHQEKALRIMNDQSIPLARKQQMFAELQRRVAAEFSNSDYLSLVGSNEVRKNIIKGGLDATNNPDLIIDPDNYKHNMNILSQISKDPTKASILTGRLKPWGDKVSAVKTSYDAMLDALKNITNGDDPQKYAGIFSDTTGKKMLVEYTKAVDKGANQEELSSILQQYISSDSVLSNYLTTRVLRDEQTIEDWADTQVAFAALNKPNIVAGGEGIEGLPEDASVVSLAQLPGQTRDVTQTSTRTKDLRGVGGSTLEPNRFSKNSLERIWLEELRDKGYDVPHSVIVDLVKRRDLAIEEDGIDKATIDGYPLNNLMSTAIADPEAMKILLPGAERITRDKTSGEIPPSFGTTRLSFDESGVDYTVTEGQEEWNTGGGPSSRTAKVPGGGIGNGIYSVGDKGSAYGNLQFNGANWNKFVKHLNEEKDLGLTRQQINDLKAGPDNRENILDFIENYVTNIEDEDGFRNEARKWGFNNLYRPAISFAEKEFGRSLAPEIRTFLTDAANQHRGVKTIIKNAKKILDKDPDVKRKMQLDPKEFVHVEADILDALTQARKEYIDGLTIDKKKTLLNRADKVGALTKENHAARIKENRALQGEVQKFSPRSTADKKKSYTLKGKEAPTQN